MFTTWITIMILALVLTVISVRHINILFSLGASIGWLSLMAYNLNIPLTNITVGSVIHQWMTLGFIALAIAVMLMFFRNRGKMVRIGGGEEVESATPERKGLMDMTPEEYKNRAGRAVRPRRRRR